MELPTFSIIGSGRMGTFIAKILVPHVKILTIVNRTKESAIQAQKLLGSGKVVSDVSEIVSSDYYMVSVPEVSIHSCAEALAKSPVTRAGQVAFHLSGAYSSDLLSPLRDKGLHIASLHPDLSVPDPAYIPPWLYATLEGDQKAVVMLKKLFSFYPIAFLSIEPKEKLLYHAALVTAANFSLVLLNLSKQLLLKTSLEEIELMLASLLMNTLQTVRQKGLLAALSGPVSRGAEKLVGEQLKLMQKKPPYL